MVDVAFSVGRLLVAFLLVFLNGFFVAAVAYVRIGSTAVDTHQVRRATSTLRKSKWSSTSPISIVEVVVGGLRDEFDVGEREPSTEQRCDGTYIADGSVPISVVNTETGYCLRDRRVRNGWRADSCSTRTGTGSG